jgi:S-adenosyl methyltransferase
VGFNFSMVVGGVERALKPDPVYRSSHWVSQYGDSEAARGYGDQQMTAHGEDAPDGGDRVRRVDMSRPSVSRVYDALLGGKDNFQADRDVRDRLLAIDPEMGRASWDLRQFLIRVTRFLAGNVGVAQFLDCSVTLPSRENVHEVALRINRESCTVYVSRDPVVLAHGRALLADNDRTHMAEADCRLPRQVIEHQTVAKHIDFGQPVALYQAGTMRYVPDERDPVGIMAAYIDALPSGSYVALAHLLDPGPGHELYELAAKARQVALDHGVGSFSRSREKILAMVGGLELLEPGLVPLADWWPDGPRARPLAPMQRLALGAVGRKP